MHIFSNYEEFFQISKSFRHMLNINICCIKKFSSFAPEPTTTFLFCETLIILLEVNGVDTFIPLENILHTSGKLLNPINSFTLWVLTPSRILRIIFSLYPINALLLVVVLKSYREQGYYRDFVSASSNNSLRILSSTNFQISVRLYQISKAEVDIYSYCL